MLQAKSKPQTLGGRRSVVAIIGIVSILIGGLAYWRWTGTPQLAADGDVYASLDALFTAVTARRESLVANCESKLVAMHSEGRIPEPAWQRIAHVLELAKAAQWESAASDLYAFIERQKQTT